MQTKVRSKEAVVEEFRIQSIRDAALRVIAKKGLGETTMQEIAAEAGIAKGTIYLYFDNRDDLLRNTAEFMFGQLNGRVEAALSSDGDFRAKFKLLVETILSFFDEHQDFFRVWAGSNGVPELNARAQCHNKLHSEHLDRLAAFFAQGVRSRKLRSCDPARLALLFQEGLGALVRRRAIESHPPAVRDDVELFVRMMLDGVSAK
jgi:AcrR family transcriptional regulator